MAKAWKIGRAEQDALALESHRRAVAAQDARLLRRSRRPVDGARSRRRSRAATPRSRSSPRLKPAFDRASGHGTITAGNSSPLTDGAAALWVATDAGLSRLPASVPRARLVDFEIAAVDIFHEGLLMAPVAAIPRLLARHAPDATRTSRCGRSTRRSPRRCSATSRASRTRATFARRRACPTPSAAFPRERVNPNGGSVALGHPFGATGARILSQAVRELAAMPRGKPRDRQRLRRRRPGHRRAPSELERVDVPRLEDRLRRALPGDAQHRAPDLLGRRH